MLFRTILMLFTIVMASSLSALPLPNGPTLLTISGAISNTNQDDVAVYDLEMLENLPQHVVATRNPWNTGTHHYRGVNPKALLEAVGATGNVLRIQALNQYITEVPIADFDRYDMVFATHMDDIPMSVRSRGPMMLVYNFDATPSLHSEIFYGRSIWQIRSIEVLTRAE